MKQITITLTALSFLIAIYACTAAISDRVLGILMNVSLLTGMFASILMGKLIGMRIETEIGAASSSDNSNESELLR